MPRNQRPEDSSEWNAFLADICRRDLSDIARQCGLTIVGTGARARALCPFHDDQRPSLTFYREQDTQLYRYHCFACTAHGDAIDLVKALRHVSFREAIEWLGTTSGLRPPRRTGRRSRKIPARQVGLETAFESYREEDANEQQLLEDWATQRGMPISFLRNGEVFAANGNKLSQRSANDRELTDALDEAGLIIRSSRRPGRPSKTAFLPLDLPPRDLFSRNRIVFTIRDGGGRIVGFAGRAIDPNDQPKYLFSRSLPKGQLLYRLDAVRQHVATIKPTRSRGGGRRPELHVVVVEGLMDALRIESQHATDGMYALATLGSYVGSGQIARIEELAREASQRALPFFVHLFLDNDDAGFRGTVSSLPRLIRAAVGSNPFSLDVVIPDSSGGHDPDELLSNCSPEESTERIRRWCRPVAEVLMAYGLQCKPQDVSQTWDQARSTERVFALSQIETLLDPQEWRQVFDVLGDGLLTTSFEPAQVVSEGSWRDRFKKFLLREPLPAIAAGHLTTRVEPSDAADILHAIQLAQASTQRREVPTDEPSWERLLAAYHVTVPWFADRLRTGARLIEDLMGVRIPKGSGEYRLKALPCPEDLAIQQYLLNELLSSRENEESHFNQLIPAVRHSTRDGVTTTGPSNLRPTTVDGRPLTVSFAYQVDMDVLQRRIQPRGDGMYRQYIDCWQAFIDFINQRVAVKGRAEEPFQQFHVARLDIRRYYDTLPHFAVNDVLFPSLRRSLEACVDIEGFARLFNANKLVRQPEELARMFVDCLCSHSFGYRYFSPQDGKPVSTERTDRGIPQGPDLSAYLANIALFPLDRRVSDAVEESKDAVVYARYVDDMVIVTRSETELSRLRAIVESQLGRIGLELSKKTDSLPPMTRAHLQYWLTDQRGGFGGYGDFEEPPVVIPPLPDDGGVDRREALVRLRDPDLYHPDTPSETIKATCSEVLICPELRFNDLTRASALIWSVVAREYDHAVDSEQSHANSDPERNKQIAKKTAESYVALWNDVTRSGHQSAREAANKDHLQIALYGLDKILRSRRFLSPAFSDEDQKTVFRRRKCLAQAVVAGVCRALEDRLQVDSSHIKFSLCVFVLGIQQVASALGENVLGVIKPAELTLQCMADSHSSLANNAAARFVISLANRYGSGLLDWLKSQEGSSPLILLHEAIARLSLSPNATTSVPIDPLDPMVQRVEFLRDGGDEMDMIVRLLRWWMPCDDTTLATEHDLFLLQTIAALLNVSRERPGQLFNRRQALLRAALNDSGQIATDVFWLPCVPVEDLEGLVGIKNQSTNQTVFRVAFANLKQVGTDQQSDSSATFVPEGLEWKQGNGGIPVEQAELEPNRWLPPTPDYDAISNPAVIKWVAVAFRELLQFQTQYVNGVECPATAFHLLGKLPNTEAEANGWGLIGYAVTSAGIRGQAFLRHGEHGLIPEKIQEPYERLWRIGYAITDWLGLVDKARSLPTQRFDTPYFLSSNAGEAEDSDARWARETILRVSLHRLCGHSVPTNLPQIAAITAVPVFIERVLQRLERFPDHSGSRWPQIAAVLAAVTESRVAAYRSRQSLQLDSTVPGAPSALLARLVQAEVRRDTRLAEQLPPVPETQFAPRRRSVLAWSHFAKRLQQVADLAAENQFDSVDIALRALAAGTRLLALQTQLRAQVLELWTLLDQEALQDIKDGAHELASVAPWNLDDQVLLHENQPGARQTDRSQVEPTDDLNQIEEPKGNAVDYLIFQLFRATRPQARNSGAALAKITPLGWIVLLGILTGMLPSRIRIVGLRKQDGADDLSARLFELAQHLAMTSDARTDGDFPWGDLASVIDEWSPGQFDTAIRTLEKVDEHTGIVVSPLRASTTFGISPGSNGTQEVRLDAEQLSLSSWQVIVASASGERQKDGTEKRIREGDNRFWFYWTESRFQDRVISIHVAQPGLAELSGFVLLNVITPDAEVTAHLDQPIPSDELPISGQDTTNSHQCSGTSDTDDSASPTEEPAKSEITSEKVGLKIQLAAVVPPKLEEHQENSWKRRRSKEPCHLRVAFAQWQVDETYSHPLFDVSPSVLRELIETDNGSDQFHLDHRLLDPDRKLVANPEYWDDRAAEAQRYLRSRKENRRRRILKQIVSACSRFAVDALLLPEYSTRPETVEWIRKELNSLGAKTVVWAGTFLKPPQLLVGTRPWLDDIPDSAAVLTVVVPDAFQQTPEGFNYPAFIPRQKKYPAIACDEMFRPMDDLLRRVIPDGPHLLAKTIELVCSEVFVATSPSNLLGLAWALSELRRKICPDVSHRDHNEDVKQDVGEFAQATSMVSDPITRRTILFVPAMTPRAVDYAVLGQASYLAAGLTTIFCNAASPCGHGQSCVIGHDGWDRDDHSDRPNLPRPGPYHGVYPGIYRPWANDRGWLAQKEQAMVIVDIDPFYSMEGKPRPQMLLPPLQLVAHLPILELRSDSNTEKIVPRDVAGASSGVGGKNAQLAKCLEKLDALLNLAENGESYKTTAGVPSEVIRDVAEQLRTLAEYFQENESWLNKRAQAFQNGHLSNPQAWPPPAALDWLLIPPGDPSFIDEIEVPPFRR